VPLSPDRATSDRRSPLSPGFAASQLAGDERRFTSISASLQLHLALGCAVDEIRVTSLSTDCFFNLPRTLVYWEAFPMARRVGLSRDNLHLSQPRNDRSARRQGFMQIGNLAELYKAAACYVVG
jgi:hypothetical protein